LALGLDHTIIEGSVVGFFEGLGMEIVKGPGMGINALGLGTVEGLAVYIVEAPGMRIIEGPGMGIIERLGIKSPVKGKGIVASCNMIGLV